MNKKLIGSKLIKNEITDNVYSIEFKLKDIVDEYYGTKDDHIILLYDEQLNSLEKEFKQENKSKKLFAFIEKIENNNEVIINYLLVDDDGTDGFRKKVLAISNNDNNLDFSYVTNKVQDIIEKKKTEEEKKEQQQDTLYCHLLYMLFLSYLREEDEESYRKWYEKFQQYLIDYFYEENKRIQEYLIEQENNYDYEEESQSGYHSR